MTVLVPGVRVKGYSWANARFLPRVTSESRISRLLIALERDSTALSLNPRAGKCSEKLRVFFLP